MPIKLSYVESRQGEIDGVGRAYGRGSARGYIGEVEVPPSGACGCSASSGEENVGEWNGEVDRAARARCPWYVRFVCAL
jgi:hypothetical protein